MGYTQDLVSWWDMSDINPADLGFRGLGNDGVGTGLVAATDIVDGIAGGKATEFNGTDEYVTIDPDPSILLTDEISVSAWFKNADINDFRIIVGHTSSAAWGKGFALYLHSSQLRFYVDVWNANFAHIPFTDVNIWHHVVGIYSKSSGVVRIFLDGVEGTPDAYAASISYEAGEGVRIGRGTGTSTQYWNGIIDEVMIFNAAMTNLQAADLYVRTRQGRF